MTRYIVQSMLVLAALVAAPDTMAAQGFLTCSSTGYRYEYCAANTQGRALIMREVSTGNLYRQGYGRHFYFRRNG